MKWGSSDRDPLDAYSEHRDWEDERLLTPRELVEKAAREKYIDLHIAPTELTNLVVWRLSAMWREQIGDRSASWSEVEFALRDAFEAAFKEMREVRTLTFGGKRKEGPDAVEGSSVGHPGSVTPRPSWISRLARFMGRNPWF